MPGFNATAVLPTTFQANWFPATTCSAWYRSDVGVTLSSGAVSTWADQSGSGRNMTTNPTHLPPYTVKDNNYNSLPSLQFSSSAPNKTLIFNNAGSLAQPITLIAIAHTTSVTFQGFIDGNTAGIGTNNGGNNADEYAGTERGTAVSVGAPSIMIAVMNGASSAFYVNSSTATITSNPGTNGLSGTATGFMYTFGSNNGVYNNCNGFMVEASIYHSALTAAQVKTWVKYAAARYNKTWT